MIKMDTSWWRYSQSFDYIYVKLMRIYSSQSIER